MTIVYKESNGNVCVISPAANWSQDMEILAQKDVPTGLKYLIVEDSFVPSDRTFRNAWEISDDELTDGVGA